VSPLPTCARTRATNGGLAHRSACRIRADQVLAAAVIEAKDLIVDVENVGDKGEALLKPHASLHVDLQVRVEVGVAVRALKSSRRGISRCLILKLVREDVRIIVRNSQPIGETAAVVCRLIFHVLGACLSK